MSKKLEDWINTSLGRGGYLNEHKLQAMMGPGWFTVLPLEGGMDGLETTPCMGLTACPDDGWMESLCESSLTFNFFRGGCSCSVLSSLFPSPSKPPLIMPVIEESGRITPLGVPSVERNFSSEFENFIWVIGTSDFTLSTGLFTMESRSP